MLFVYSHIWRLTDAMTALMQQSRRRAQTGQGLVEYALIIAVVAVVAVVGLTLMGGQLKSMFSTITNQIQAQPAGSPTATPIGG